MKEDFLHFIWQNGFFKHEALMTTALSPVKILQKGMPNSDAGPDFFNAQIMIDTLQWNGNVEIHKYSSDWYAHGHEKDPAYDNVILHVVWEDDMPVYNSNNNQIPTLELSKYILKDVLKNYNKLVKNKCILRCQNDLNKVDYYVLFHFKYRLFIERLEEKYLVIQRLLRETKNNWNQIFYQTLLKYIGGPVNKDAFELLGRLLPYEVIIKYQSDLLHLEALLFGVAGLLNDQKNDAYFQLLKQEYDFLKVKHNLQELPAKAIKFHRLRPANFPTIRLAQLARLYYQNDHLFEKIIAVKTSEQAYELLTAVASQYWDTHYNFEKITKAKKKITGTNFMDIILINVIVPLKFAYQKYLGQLDNENVVNLIEQIKPEKNRIVDAFTKVDLEIKNALDTQAILQLNNNYCLKKRCLSCDIGHYIIKQGLE